MIRIAEADGLREHTDMRISVEVIALILLICMAVVPRLVQLGSVPMTPAESPGALAAWRSIASQTGGSPLAADGVMVYWAQRLAFALLGGTELAARLGTAVAGILLGLSPLFFRDLFGRARAYLMTLLLTLSPVMLAASRFSADSVWTMLLVILGLWAIWQHSRRQTMSQGWAVAGITMLGMAGLLTGPSGPVVLITLALAWVLTVLLGAWAAPLESDVPGDEYLLRMRGLLSGLPWSMGLAFTGFGVIILSTGFLLYPGGLSMVGEAVGGFVDGVLNSSHPFDPRFFPLLTSIFYDPWLWILATGAIALLMRRDEVTPVNRFLMSWALAAAVTSMVYRGGTAADSLWTVVPLVGLAAHLIADAFDQEPDYLWYQEGDEELQFGTPSKVKWISAAAALTLLFMLSIHFQMVSRGILLVENGSLLEFLSHFRDQTFARHMNSLVWLFVATMLLGVGFFLVSSQWGMRLPGRSLVLAMAAFAVLSNFGSGWRIAISEADSPVEPWHTVATTQDAVTLRSVMGDLAFRETKGQRGMPIAVMAAEDSVVAWLLRDYVSARFIVSPAQGRREQVILLPLEAGESPDLGGNYVGQRVQVSRTWGASSLQGFDTLAWWSTQQTRADAKAMPYETYVLWVRQDVFDGQPFEDGAG